MVLPASDQRAYYRAALACLRCVETRRPTTRRFGAEAEARWKAFKGHLSVSDRIDLLLRDANAEWPGAFGARGVFALEQVAEDEAFGASWPLLDGVTADTLWREQASAQAASSPQQALTAVAEAWGLRLAPVAIEPVDAADRILAVGPSAIVSLAQAFVGRSDLDWADQVACVATPAAHRHLALAAIAVVDAHKPARVLTHTAALHDWKCRRTVRSDDAARADAAAVAQSGA